MPHAHIQGMLVTLKTKTGATAGTDDHLYVGVFGKRGGSEFPLDVRGFNDFEPGANVKYWFGDVWDGNDLAGAKRPYAAGSWNDPGSRHINLYHVEYVYLRKHSHKGSDADDAWKMNSVEVILYTPENIDYGQPNAKRTFQKWGDLWLANEFELQVWLREGDSWQQEWNGVGKIHRRLPNSYIQTCGVGAIGFAFDDFSQSGPSLLEVSSIHPQWVSNSLLR